jgi:pimeloyl-ACP methyl ester carboxylesterase
MARAMDAARHADVREAVRNVECPVLVARGPHDRICPEDWAQELASMAPAGSRAVTLSSGAHMVPLTHGRLLAAALGDFLDRGDRWGPPWRG